MKEKLTITPQDKKYMNSIGKGSDTTPPLRPKRIESPKLIKRAQANTEAIKRKITPIGKGRSHFSGKDYNL